MSDSDLSIESVSAQKSQSAVQQAQVTVAKKQQDQQASVEQQLIEGATERALPPGVGGKLNTVA